VRLYSQMSIRLGETLAEGDSIGVLLEGMEATTLLLSMATDEEVQAGQGGNDEPGRSPDSNQRHPLMRNTASHRAAELSISTGVQVDEVAADWRPCCAWQARIRHTRHIVYRSGIPIIFQRSST
jgi:hypothetical protein